MLNGADNNRLHTGVRGLELKEKVGSPGCDLAVTISKLVDDEPEQVGLLLGLVLEKAIDEIEGSRPRVFNLIGAPGFQKLENLEIGVLEPIFVGPADEMHLGHLAGQGLPRSP